MRVLLMALLLAMPGLPLASAAATCDFPEGPLMVCRSESSTAPDDCATGNGLDRTDAQVYSYTPTTGGLSIVSVFGQERCHEGEGSRIVGASVQVVFFIVFVGWHENDAGCGMTVLAAVLVAVWETLPCAASPPNPGWGSLLP